MTAVEQREPVRWDPEAGVFQVSGFTEASAVLRGDGWSNDIRLNPLLASDRRGMQTDILLFTDPREHARFRSLLGPVFTPKEIGRLQPRIEAIVERLLDEIVTLGPEIDVVEDIGSPVTIAVIAELLDIGVEGAQVLADNTLNLGLMLEFDASPDDLLASAVSVTELMLFLTPILAERKHHLGEDSISALLALQDVPGGLNVQEIMAICIMLVAAGHETTASSIGNATLALMNDRDQLPNLFADPARAIEELLRLDGIAKITGRTALVDQCVGGVDIAEGQTVIIDFMHANRDPRRFPDPLLRDLTRAPLPNLAFGGGIHFCLGASLARLLIAQLLTKLFARFPNLSPSNTPHRWRNSMTFHRLESLPAFLDP
jgi:cytochrome P450